MATSVNQHLLFVTHRSGHHAARSGYWPLADYFPGVKIADKEGSLPYRIKKRLSHVRPDPYSSTSVAKEYDVLRHMLRYRGGLAHFLHGEHDFYYTGFASRALKWQTVATFHHPPSDMRNMLPNTAFLRRLDGLIGVGTNQLDYLREQVNHDRVWFVPHGVDTDYFVPPERDDYGESCLCVGQHLRDFSLLGEVLDGLRKVSPTVTTTAILRADQQRALPADPSLIRKSGVSDDGLRQHYQSAALLLLPLRDVTASNAILEALACGLPIVISDVGGARDYVDESSGFLCKNAGEMIEAAEVLLRDPALNLRMRRAAREKALTFAWPVVAARLADLYRREFNFEPFLQLGP